MDKSKIPTKEITVGKDDNLRTIKIYEWLTQDEEDERMRIMMGDQEVDVDEASSNADGKGEAKIKMKMKYDGVAQARKYLVEHMCVDLEWAEFNAMNPTYRADILSELEGQVNKKK